MTDTISQPKVGFGVVDTFGERLGTVIELYQNSIHIRSGRLWPMTYIISSEHIAVVRSFGHTNHLFRQKTATGQVRLRIDRAEAIATARNMQ